MKRGLLLVAHGARNPAWAHPFQRLLERVRAEHHDRPAVLAFLELMEPSPEQGLRQLADAGVQAVEVLPMFLGGAGHVQRDLGPMLQAAQERMQLTVRVHPALGEQPAMLDAMAALCLHLLDEPGALR